MSRWVLLVVLACLYSLPAQLALGLGALLWIIWAAALEVLLRLQRLRGSLST
jgi:hypothetical protein